MECWFTVSKYEWLKGIVRTAKRVNTARRSKENRPARDVCRPASARGRAAG